MKPDDRQPEPPLRYGDFPALFWDAQPDVAIDVRDPITLARLLTRGRPEVIGRLVPLEVVQQELNGLPLPEHVLMFWRVVLRRTPDVTAGVHPPGENS